MLNIKVVSWSLGLFAAISFVLCVIYGLIGMQALRNNHTVDDAQDKADGSEQPQRPTHDFDV